MSASQGLRVAVVGGGRVGTVLVRALPGAAGPYGRGHDGSGADVVVLAVPDRELAAAAAAVLPRDGLIVGHCSGATSLDVLAPHEAFGLHPLMTVTVGAGPAVLAGAPAAVAGSTPRAAAIAGDLAQRAGMRPFAIDDADRATYHAAASVASNFLVTLEDAAEVLLSGLGLDRSVLVPLVRTTLANWERDGRAALTGPVARGDDDTVARQRAAIERDAPALLGVFDALVDRTRAIARDVRAGDP